jgi:predicted phosphodiesterase
MSDLHLEFAPYMFQERDDVDLYINAGDITTGNRPTQFSNYIHKHNKLFYVHGNHDFYGSVFVNTQPKMMELNGVKIAGATLWTDLTKPLDWLNYVNNLADARCIIGLDYETYKKTHARHLDFLLRSEADVIVSHHAPSYLSVSEEYKGSFLNPGFVTELGNEIAALKKPPKLWVHGHVHGRFDYMIGETRVVCNPRGYPGENAWFDTYEPMIVEI